MDVSDASQAQLETPQATPIRLPHTVPAPSMQTSHGRLQIRTLAHDFLLALQNLVSQPNEQKESQS